MKDDREVRDAPRIVAFPPFIFLGTLALGIAIHLVKAARALPNTPARLAGALFLVIFVVLGISAEQAMRHAGTNIRPDRPTTAIVDSGPFRFTRNPLYMAAICGYLGIALLVNSIWPILLLLPMLILLQEGVVKREERYLERKFGDDYLNYRRRVRRWF